MCHDAHVEIFPSPISRTAQGFSLIAKFVQELPVDVFTDDWVMVFGGLLAPLQKCINGLFAFQDDEVGKLPLKGGIALSTEVFGSTKTACRIDTTTIMKIGTTIFSDECSFLPTGGILISRKNNIWRAKSKRTQNSGCSITFWIYQNSTTGYDENSRNKEYVSHNATGSIQASKGDSPKQQHLSSTSLISLLQTVGH